MKPKQRKEYLSYLIAACNTAAETAGNVLFGKPLTEEDIADMDKHIRQAYWLIKELEKELK